MMLSASDILNASILIVDDQDANVKLLERLLGEAGYANIASTMSPRDVDALHRKNRYDLILLDVKTRIHNMLEVRLLQKKLESYNEVLEQTVQERTAELRESETRFRRLTELASDWYWEQNETGEFTQVSGPVMEMLGLRMAAFLGDTSDDGMAGWNEAERMALKARIAARQPFLDFAFSRVNADGSQQQFRVSGEPMFDQSCSFTGYS